MSPGSKTFFEISDIQEDDIALKLATTSIRHREADLGPDQVSRKGACMPITPSLFEAYATTSRFSFGLTAAERPLLVLPCANRHRGFPAAIGSGGRALGMLRRTL